MKVISQTQAKRIQKENPGSTVGRYCSGKYKPLPSEWVGRDLVDSDRVLAIYGVRQRDNHGPYTRLKCILKP